MTTSRDTTFSSTGSRIVFNAFSHIQVVQKGQNLDADDAAFGEEMLNGLLKSWQADGLHLWNDKEAAVFFQNNRRTYLLGNQADTVYTPGQDAVVENPVFATNGDWVHTTTTAAQTSPNNVISVESYLSYNGVQFDPSQGVVYVGIYNVDEDLQWTTVNSVTNLDITLTDNLTADVDEDSTVFIFRDVLDKPLRIYDENARVWQRFSNYELPIHMLAWTDYNLLPQKDTTGVTVQAAYQPKIDNGLLAVWPVSDSLENVFLFRYQQGFDIFDGTRTQDLPAEWIRALEWALAAELGQSYGVPPQRQQYLDMKASNLKDQALGWDQDNSSMYIYPRKWGN